MVRIAKYHWISLLLLTFLLVNCAQKQSLIPVLVLGTDANFGSYAGEILKAEGFNAFKTDSLASPKITGSYLRQFDVVILAETSVTSEQKSMLTGYVKAGGNLIAFRPDKKLSDLFGITDANSTVKEGYLKINTSGDIGKGLVSETIQFHGVSDVYRLNGGEEIASLYSDAQNSTGSPSVVINKSGDGHAVAFTYNLPKSIVYTRQGNPEWAGQERDNVDGPTATDLFYPLNGETQWNNPDKIAIPQADEQMRLLSHIIGKINSGNKPLPRFWYFPDEYKCVYIFTIDGEESSAEDINNEILDVQAKGGNATLYEIGTYISDSIVRAWRSNGHEVAIHYNDVPNYSNPTFRSMNTVFDTMTTNFRNAYNIMPRTGRNHWVVWCSTDSLGRKEFAQHAIIEEKYGVGFDCNYYQFGGNKVYPNWMGDVGHITGSGIPMKFSDSSGKIIHVYQSNTQLPDETWLKDNVEAKSKTLIGRSLHDENYTWVNANYHTWYWPETREAGLKVLDYCNSNGVPIWTAEKAYDFIKMKDEARFSEIKWANNMLTFKLVSTLEHSNGLTFLLPASYNGAKIRNITLNGQEKPFGIKMIKGFHYAAVTVTPGNSYEVSASY